MTIKELGEEIQQISKKYSVSYKENTLYKDNEVDKRFEISVFYTEDERNIYIACLTLEKDLRPMLTIPHSLNGLSDIDNIREILTVLRVFLREYEGFRE